MASVQAVWGLDMGRSALKAIKLRLAGDGKVEILGHDYIEHAKILSQPDADRHALIAAALEKFLAHNDLSKDLVFVGVPGQQTLARFTKLPPVAPKRIPDIVQYEADQQIPFDMDEVIWDYQTFQEEGAPDLEVGIFAMKRELIREHLLHFEQAAIEPIGVQSGPLAVYNAAHFDGLLADDTTMLLDIGAENTDVVIGTKECFWTRTIPIGGNAFTEALVKSFKLSFAKAEGLKKTADSSKYARQIFQAMRPIFADLVQELQRSVGFYSSTHRDAEIQKLVVFGDAFRLPNLRKYLQQNLGLPVEQPATFSTATGQTAGALKEHILSFGVAFGLAIQGLDKAKVQTNLLPTEIAKQVVWRKKRPAFAAAAACVLIAGGLVWFRQTSDMRALAASSVGAETVEVEEDRAAGIVDIGPSPSLGPRAQATQVLRAGENLKRQLAALTGQGANERAQTETLIALQENKRLIPNILDVIHDSVPQASGELATAQTQEEVRAAIASGSAPPRGQRRQVVLTGVDMSFEPNIRAYDWTSVIAVPDPINSHSIDESDDLPGILVKILCQTPNAGGAAYVRDSFVKNLREKGRVGETGFYFDHMILLSGEKVVTSNAPTPGRGSGRGAARFGQPTGIPPQSRDPITDEPMETDWKFEIWASVILDDLSDLEETDGAQDNDQDDEE